MRIGMVKTAKNMQDCCKRRTRYIKILINVLPKAIGSIWRYLGFSAQLKPKLKTSRKYIHNCK